MSNVIQFPRPDKARTQHQINEQRITNSRALAVWLRQIADQIDANPSGQPIVGLTVILSSNKDSLVHVAGYEKRPQYLNFAANSLMNFCKEKSIQTSSIKRFAYPVFSE